MHDTRAELNVEDYRHNFAVIQQSTLIIPIIAAVATACAFSGRTDIHILRHAIHSLIVIGLCGLFPLFATNRTKLNGVRFKRGTIVTVLLIHITFKMDLSTVGVLDFARDASGMILGRTVVIMVISHFEKVTAKGTFDMVEVLCLRDFYLFHHITSSVLVNDFAVIVHQNGEAGFLEPVA
jgi:hypothetical protein